MMRNILCILFACLSLLSCKQKEHGHFMNNVSLSAETLKKNVQEKGDTLSYQRLRVMYLEDSIQGLLPSALTMADKYRYLPACFDVYYIILASNNRDLYQLDSLKPKDREIALKYLTKAAKGNHESAIDILDSIRNRK